MATKTFGATQEFQPGSEPISAYLEQLKAYLDANDIADKKREAILISVIGHKTYAVLRSLMAPDAPQSKSYDALVKALESHYEPKPHIIAERDIFHQRGQTMGESISEYVAELRRLASICNFGEFLNDALRDRLVCGLRSDSARRHLLAVTDESITLAKVIEKAQSYEQAERNARALKGTEAVVKKFSLTTCDSRGDTAPQHRPCYRCGRTNHDAKECRFADAACNFCKKKGHIAPACLKKKGKTGSRKYTPNTKYMSTASDDSDAEEFHLLTMGSKSSQPISIDVLIEGKSLSMELDTGAAFSVISEQTYEAQFAELKLRKSGILLKTYTDECIPVRGQLNVHVQYGEQRASLVLLVVAGDGPTLLGRNWLKYIRLDWKKIHAVSKTTKSAPVADLLRRHDSIFAEELVHEIGLVSSLPATASRRRVNEIRDD